MTGTRSVIDVVQAALDDINPGFANAADYQEVAQHAVSGRQRTLDAAAQCVLQDRNRTYGGPENSFRDIASGWSVIAGHPITGTQVGLMMAWLKIVRAKDNPGHTDSFTDLVGYGACAAELAEIEGRTGK